LIRYILVEYFVEFTSWPEVVTIIMCIKNGNPVKNFGERLSNQVAIVNGLLRKSPICVIDSEHTLKAAPQCREYRLVCMAHITEPHL